MELKFLNPEEVLSRLELEDNMIAADFGCGSGGWVIPLSKVLDNGQVYAIDFLGEPLSAIEGKIRRGKIENIIVLKEDVEEKVSLRDNYCDLVLMTNLLFQCHDIKKVIGEGARILRKEGKLLIVDWSVKKLGVGEIVPPSKVIEIAIKLGLKVDSQFDAGGYHYGLIISKL